MAGELQRFKSTLIYETQAPAEQIVADLQEIREFDRRSEGKLKIYTAGIVIGAVVAVGGAFLHSVAAIAVGVCVLLPAIVLRTIQSKFDLANRRYELLGELVRVLGRDMPKGASFDVGLDLTRPNHKRKQTNTGDVGPWKVVYYTDPWLKLSGRFADGTVFRLSLTEKYQARTKWKRSRSGKNKMKSKTKVATQVCVRLFPKRKRYQHVEQVSRDAETFLRLPTWTRVKQVRSTERGLALTTVTDQDWTVRRIDPETRCDAVELLATMLLSLYQVLHVSAATAAGK